jgi:UDP-N-acetylmuramoylalanine--D-glutamate ligase
VTAVRGNSSAARTVILGLGVTGVSCVRHFVGRGAVVVLDTRDQPPHMDLVRSFPQVEYHFGSASNSFEFNASDVVVVSPGLPLEHPLVQKAAHAGSRITSDVELFLDAVASTGAEPVFAITGTNGKSTVTALAGHLLRALGCNPGVGGNLGEAALDLLRTPRDCWVLELSSFQLERLPAYPFAAATVLNLSDDHLDRHGTMAAYGAAKRRVYRDAKRRVFNREDAATFPSDAASTDGRACHSSDVSFGVQTPATGQWGLRMQAGQRWLACGDINLVAEERVLLAGTHNLANALAALALVAPGDLAQRPAQQMQLRAGVESFVGLPHRCVNVATRGGVRFVNDSKATNVGATLAALAGLGRNDRRNVVLIAGGEGKGADFAPLRPAVGRHVKAVVLIGRDAPRLAEVLHDLAPLERASDMRDAVRRAAALAACGDTVLLAPACASLDMFANYAARGDAFAAAVEQLA